MRRMAVVMVMGMVIVALAAPIIPLAIVTLELADLLSCLPAAAVRAFARDLDPCGLLRSSLTRTVSAVKRDQVTAVLLLC